MQQCAMRNAWMHGAWMHGDYRGQSVCLWVNASGVGDAVGCGCGCGLRRDQLAVRVHVGYAFLGQVMC